MHVQDPVAAALADIISSTERARTTLLGTGEKLQSHREQYPDLLLPVEASRDAMENAGDLMAIGS